MLGTRSIDEILKVSSTSGNAGGFWAGVVIEVIFSGGVVLQAIFEAVW